MNNSPWGQRFPSKRPYLIVALVLALIATACGSDNSGQARVLDGDAATIFSGECATTNDEDEVVIYSGRTENLIEPVIDAFICETGTSVSVRWGSSTDLALLLSEEGDATDADVFLSRSPGPVGFLQSRNLLGTVDPDVLSLVDAQNQSDSGSWVGFSGRKRVAVYNVDAVTDAQLPSSVFELTDEVWNNRVAIPATNGSFVDWFTVFRDQVGDDVATQWINDMAANGARYYPNNRSIVEAAGRGEVDLGLVNHYYNHQESKDRGADHRAQNHDFDAADFGSVVIITAATVTSASDNTEGANALIEYLLSQSVQTYLTESTLEYPLAAGVQPADVLPPLTTPAVGSVDFDALGGGFEESTTIIDASGIADQ